MAAPLQRLQPRQELGECEGLGQVVVAAGTQPFDPIVDIAERAHDQDGSRVLPRPKLRDDGEAIELGEHAVDHQRVEFAVRRVVEALAAVDREIDLMAALA